METPVQIRTSSCETIYKIGEHEIVLWIITGGTPALDFVNWGYTKRYPIKDRRWVEVDFEKEGFPRTGNFISTNGIYHYKHQNPMNIQGPTLDVLPEGEKTLDDFLCEMLPKKELRESRLAQFPVKTVKSKRYHDKEDHCFFYLLTDVQYGKVSPVAVISAIYCGRMDEKITLPCVAQSWKDLDAFANPLFDSHLNSGKVLTLDDLTEDQFQTFLKLYVGVLI